MYLNILMRTVIRNNKFVFPKHTRSSANMCSVTLTQQELINCVRSFVPVMNKDMHKGQCGRIGVIGGCKEYTGAPYFAAISSLKVGADLSHVFCMNDAAVVIKSYSPELIVHPLLDSCTAIDEIAEWLPRLHSLVVGPGLGRNPAIFDNFKGILFKAMHFQLPLVIDADGVYFITQDPNVIKGYKKAILTPNGIEFIRLYEKVFGKRPSKEQFENNTRELAQELGLTIVCKGENDIITDGKNMLLCTKEGSVRRCGGQGDLLSGSMGTFIFWGHVALEKQLDNIDLLKNLGPNLCAAYGACFLTRECNKMAFTKNKRSMTTSDMITCIGEVFQRTFDTA